MIWTMLAILLVLQVAARPVRKAVQSRREGALEAAEQFRTGRKVVSEDVTVFGEQLAELHVNTLTTALEGPCSRTTSGRSRRTSGPSGC
jgi:flagellar biosynthesis/type III secretory pathway M-ring protein FliF/YscJ